MSVWTKQDVIAVLNSYATKRVPYTSHFLGNTIIDNARIITCTPAGSMRMYINKRFIYVTDNAYIWTVPSYVASYIQMEGARQYTFHNDMCTMYNGFEQSIIGRKVKQISERGIVSEQSRQFIYSTVFRYPLFVVWNDSKVHVYADNNSLERRKLYQRIALKLRNCSNKTLHDIYHMLCSEANDGN